jgi:sugar O-acyltransferase (sialic acid O-acetyltransferase NeuD family)
MLVLGSLYTKLVSNRSKACTLADGGLTVNTSNKISEKPSILLWGGKSKARVIEEMVKESDAGVIEIIFDNTIENLMFETSATFINDIQILKNHIKTVSHYIVCIGAEHGYARFKTAEYLEKAGLKPVTLMHAKSFVEPTSTIGYGCQVMPCAVVHKFCIIGNHTIINTNATIDHECLIGDGVHIMGNAAIAGKVEIGDYATIGTNSTILPFVKIGEGAFVGAGAVVTKDVKPYAVVAGVPAKTIRKNEFQFSKDLLITLTS